MIKIGKETYRKAKNDSQVLETLRKLKNGKSITFYPENEVIAIKMSYISMDNFSVEGFITEKKSIVEVYNVDDTRVMLLECFRKYEYLLT